MSTNFSGGARRESETTLQRTPPVDILEYSDKIVILADMPGVVPSGVTAEFEKGRLLIRGRRELRPDSGKLLRAEYAGGDFVRSFDLPHDRAYELDPAKAEAKIREGVLELTLPKSEAAKPRKIAVHSAS